MKRVLLMLAATAAFACTTAVAQAGGAGTGTAGSSTTGSNSIGASQDTAAGQTGTAHHHKGGMKGEKSGKMSTLTGCLSASANADGMYTLSNGRYKKGVEVGPTDKVQAHAGHQVALKGHWSTAAAAGENTSGVAAPAGNEKNEKHFEVDSVKHISDTCKEAAGGGTVGHKGHKKSKSSTTGA